METQTITEEGRGELARIYTKEWIRVSGGDGWNDDDPAKNPAIMAGINAVLAELGFKEE
ncbi:MAG: hypothetical protein KOO60_10820 [Gemmatimonadales bacterium]|nr:hypothetical protein [Gemmatimonadales bacterium]